MPVYICPRCRYNTKIKTHMMNHFNRKKKCKVNYNNLSIEDCIIKLKNTKNAVRDPSIFIKYVFNFFVLIFIFMPNIIKIIF